MMQVSGIMGLRQAMEYNFNRSKLIIGLLNLIIALYHINKGFSVIVVLL